MIYYISMLLQWYPILLFINVFENKSAKIKEPKAYYHFANTPI